MAQVDLARHECAQPLISFLLLLTRFETDHIEDAERVVQSTLIVYSLIRHFPLTLTISEGEGVRNYHISSKKGWDGQGLPHYSKHANNAERGITTPHFEKQASSDLSFHTLHMDIP